jgi:hypothetical protein
LRGAGAVTPQIRDREGPVPRVEEAAPALGARVPLLARPERAVQRAARLEVAVRAEVPAVAAPPAEVVRVVSVARPQAPVSADLAVQEPVEALGVAEVSGLPVARRAVEVATAGSEACSSSATSPPSIG